MFVAVNEGILLNGIHKIIRCADNLDMTAYRKECLDQMCNQIHELEVGLTQQFTPTTQRLSD